MNSSRMGDITDVSDVCAHNSRRSGVLTQKRRNSAKSLRILVNWGIYLKTMGIQEDFDLK